MGLLPAIVAASEVRWYEPVSQAVEEPLGDVSEAVVEGGDGLAVLSGDSSRKAALLDELQDHVGDLQEEVEAPEQIFISAVDVFQFISTVLEGIETLVLSLPTISSSLLGNGDDVFRGDQPIGDPGEGGLPAVLGLDALNGVEGVGSALVVDVGQAVDPGCAAGVE